MKKMNQITLLTWPMAKLFGIRYLVGKIEVQIFISGSIA